MKLAADFIAFGEIPAVAEFEGDILVLNHRKLSALKLIADCKQCLASKHVTPELDARIEALKMQDKAMSTYEAIEILLDYAEREMRASEREENGKDNLLLNFLKSLKRFLKFDN